MAGFPADTDAVALRLAARAGAGPTSDFDLNPGTPPPAKLRPAGVLIALRDTAAGPELYLTMRSAHLKHHPGQIAFPGGKQDDGDADAVAAALREAREEIGLDPANVEVLGELSPHRTVTAFSVTPVVARLRAPFTPVPEAGEVEEVFTVPLAHVADPARYRVEGRIWQGRKRFYYAVPYGPYYIWGATARILRALAAELGP